MLLGYARVSKSDDSQDTAGQVSALKSAGCKRVFEDKASGGRWDRPELHRLLDQLRTGDTLVVWKLDRLSRSLKDLLHILERVEAVGARFRSLTEAIDTSGPAGRMLMQMLGSFAEFERAMVRERRADAGGPEGSRGAGPEGRTAAQAHAGAEDGDPGRPWLRPEECGGSRAAVSGAPRYHQPSRRPDAGRCSGQGLGVMPGHRAARWWLEKVGCRRARLLLRKSDAKNKEQPMHAGARLA